MEFFDLLIGELSDLLNTEKMKFYPYSSENLWEEEDISHVILGRDMLSELDGTGFNLVTSKEVTDGVFVIGDELQNIKGKRKFTRVTVVQINDSSDEQKSYNLIRKIDYVKYHFFPKGFMIRTSSRAHKEGVRVSKTAAKNGISFSLIGNLLIKKYKETPAVKGVAVYYITDEKADYGRLEAMAEKSNRITETLNHVMNSIKFDCDTCNLKPICDEVEGMKELHFKNKDSGML